MKKENKETRRDILNIYLLEKENQKKRKKTENTPYNLALDFNFSYSIKALAISSAASVK